MSYLTMDKKIIHPALRDPIRTYSVGFNDELITECSGQCSHPICDFSYLSLKAHHIIHHARGGLTIKPNGLMLCTRCHRLLHDGFIPQRLAFSIKYWISSGRKAPLIINQTSADELVSQAEKIKFDNSLSVNARFTLLNDLLIAANFLSSRNARYFTFINIIAAKIGVLNNGTSSLRSSLNAMLISMDCRRKWAQILAANATRYAKEINHHWLALYFTHSRAVGFNARNRFGNAVNEFRKALNLWDTIPKSRSRHDEAVQIKHRLLREMAVCRSKKTQNSTKAKSEVLTSLDMAEAIGDHHNIDDALVRCVEGLIYLNELSRAEVYLDRLYGNWERLDNHLKTITMKMDARLALAQNRTNRAKEMIEKGLKWSLKYRFHHQSYHFKRLDWNMKLVFQNKRQSIIT